MAIKSKYFIITGILLVILTGAWLTTLQVNNVFKDPNVFYLVEDRLVDMNKLRVLTRGFNDIGGMFILTWEYSQSKLTMLQDKNIAAVSSLSIQGAGGVVQKDLFAYKGDNDTNKVTVEMTRKYAKGIFKETTIIDSKATFESFPSEHIIEWNPIDDKNYSLIWTISSLQFKDDVLNGVFNSCSLVTRNNVKIDYCNEKSNIYNSIINKTNKTLIITFKPKKGIQKYDIKITDPWFKLFPYAQILTLDTTQLSANVDNDHTILVYVKPTNTDFWTNHSQIDANGMTFANADCNVEYNWDIEKYSNTDKNGFFWVKVTDTFTSSVDTNICMLYGGSHVDYSDKTNAYASDMNYFLQFKDGAGQNVSDATINNNYGFLETPVSQYGWDTGLINGDYNFLYENQYMRVNNIPTTDSNFTLLLQVLIRNKATEQIYASFKNNPVNYNIIAEFHPGACPGPKGISFSDNTALCSTTNIDENIWYSVGIKYSESDFNKTVYFNGNNEGSQVDNLDLYPSDTMFYAYGITGTIYFKGFTDNIRMYNRSLSDNEVKLLYLSDSDKLVTFNSQQYSPFNLDVNVVYPNATGITFYSGQNINIDFNLFNNDFNASDILIDINYNDNNTSGGNIIINDGNVAITNGLSCDSNNLSTIQLCHYTWVIPTFDTKDKNKFIIILVETIATTSIDASDNNFNIKSKIFGNVNENYSSDINKMQLYPSSLVDSNVQPKGQTDLNGYYVLNYAGQYDGNLWFILQNKRYLDNFENSVPNYKRKPQTNASLSLIDYNGYTNKNSLVLPVNYDFNTLTRNSTWINNQFTWDLNNDYYLDGNIYIKLKVTDATKIEDINIIIGHNINNYVWLDLNQTRDSNLTSNVWFNWLYDLNSAYNKKIGNINWTDINYMSINIKQVSGISSDLNVLIDSITIQPTTEPLLNWHNGTRFCMNTENTYVNCKDVNTLSATLLVPTISSGDSNKIWVYADTNLTGYTPYDIFDFDFNYSIGSVPNAN